MAEEVTNDVNNDQGSSPSDQGVKADSPPAQDVNASPADSSTGEPTAHEQTVPYERLKAEIAKRKELEERLAAAEAPREPEEPSQPPQFDWSLFGSPADSQQQSSQQQQVQALSPDDIEQRIRDDMYNKPFQTLYPIMMEAAKQVIREDRQKEKQVRRFKDFRDVEPIFYEVPDDLVLNVQSNPEVIRYLLAKNQASMTGAPPPPPPASMQRTPQTTGQPAPSNGPAQSTDPMETLREQYRREGEERMLAKMRQQQGLQAEGTQSIPSTTGEEPELTDDQKRFYAQLGIKPDRFNQVAKRLDAQTKGRR